MKKKPTQSAASFPVNPKFQKLLLASAALLWLMPLGMMAYYMIFTGNGSNPGWGFIAVQSVQFLAPAAYYLLSLWLLRGRQVGRLAWFFHAGLVTFVAYCLVMVVGQIMQSLIFSLVYQNGYNGNNFWANYGTFIVPQILGAIVLVICLWKGRKGGLGRG